MVMQAEEQHDQCITLRLVEAGQEVGAAGAPAPAPRDQEGTGIAHHIHEVDEGRHHAAHDHKQHCELLVHPFEQPVKREYEEDQDHGTEQIAQHAESEEPLVRGDVAGRRGCVAVHEEFVGDVDEAQRAAQYEEQVPESNHSSWIAGRAHVPSVAERVRSQVSGRYATSGWEVSSHPSPAARTISNNPAPRATAPVARATRSPAGARRSTVMAAATTAIARTFMTPMTRRMAIRPTQHWLQWRPRLRPCCQAVRSRLPAGASRQQ